MTNMNESNQQSFSIFSFVNYREFLKAYFEEIRKTDNFFSYRYLERMSGLSRSYFKLLIDGKRNVSPVALSKLAKAFKLTKKEVAYFETLVLYNQAENDEEKDRHFERLMSLRPPLPIKGMTSDQYECFTKTYFTEIREMSIIPGFQENPQWICEHLRRPLKPKEAKHALEVLERLGLLVRDANGVLKHSETTLETPLHAESLDIFNYHRQLLNEGKEAIMEAPFDEWDVGTITIPMPKELVPQVMEMLKKCREEIADLINRGSKNYHEVFQVNMQLFSVSKINQNKKGSV